jgi:hypothetical protein
MASRAASTARRPIDRDDATPKAILPPPRSGADRYSGRAGSLHVHGPEFDTDKSSKLWSAANQPKPPDPWTGLASCRGCPLGESHATGRPPDPFAAVRESLRMTCSRCNKKSEWIVRPATLGYCLSCYNRNLEALKGKNAKGTRPALSEQLHTGDALISEGDQQRVVIRTFVPSFTELTTQVRRRATGPLEFSRLIIPASHACNENTGEGALTTAVRSRAKRL